MSKDYPQPDHFFKISNDLAENLGTINLSPYESRYLWVFFRLSYGWINEEDTEKREEKLSMANIIRITGLDKRNAYRARKGLVAKGLIRESKPHPTFNKGLGDWKTGVSVETLSAGVSRDTKKVSIETPTPMSVETPPYIIERNIKERKKDTPPIPYEEIIGILNKKTGKNFRHATPKYQSCIRARWNEGFRTEDFEKVIENRVAKWADDAKMAEYLRPETLFGTKFEGYLNDNGSKPQIELQATPKEEIDGLYE